jgi:hypothetical protein
MPYKHTQIGRSIIITTVIMACAAFLFQAWIVGAILCIVGFLFSRLTVFVDAEDVSVSFGLGLFKKVVLAIDIESCKRGEHRFWPWGIWGWPGKGWLFSVGGSHTVEIKMRDGMRYCIGTDKPEDLEKAVHEAMREAVHLAIKID